MGLVNFLLGRKLATSEGEERKLNTIEGVPAMGLDGLGSSAYGPEAALTILIPLGAASLAQIVPIMLAILMLLGVLYLSYWQTIEAYPNNGGAYVVAKENLGSWAGLLAATALMIDYILNVAVGISAGVGALTSGVPSLHPFTLPLCLGVLGLITIVNLRGTMEAGLAFSIPTYIFVASFFAIIGIGIWQVMTAGGAPAPVVAPPHIPAATEGVTLWLLLRAFASGCTAMTGVEAVSNGVSAFRDPTVTYAHRTLTVIVVVLGILLAGIAYLAHVHGIAAMDQTKPGYQSVLAQLTAAVVGRGWFYFVAIGSLLAILSLSANTSFVGFPRLCRMVAADGYLPRAFAVPGRRLVFSAGILWLTLTAGLLLTVFGGITDRLIPLFAVGAFLAFTMSQAGMAVHWYRRLTEETARHRTRLRLAINGGGAVATAAALLIIVAAKFIEGAWITVIAIPLVLGALLVVRRYYDQIERQLDDSTPVDLGSFEPPILLIPIKGIDRLTLKAIEYALRISPDIIVIHVRTTTDPEEHQNAAELRESWRIRIEAPAREAGFRPPRLVQLPSEYRSVAGPLLKYIADVRRDSPSRSIAVVLPELVKAHAWDYLLHTGRAMRLRRILLQHGGLNLGVITVPWTLEAPQPGKIIAEEEPEIAPAAGSRAKDQPVMR
ncbi:MAG: APC family permease [Alphaproteobacteria bacterium]|nr:APC family permease [Alphaproteobacteria bacterium]